LESIIAKDSLSHDISEKDKSSQLLGTGSSEKLDRDVLEIFSRNKSNNDSFQKLSEKDNEMASQDQEKILSGFSKKEIDESNERVKSFEGSNPKEKELQIINTSVKTCESKNETGFKEDRKSMKEISPNSLSNGHKGNYINVVTFLALVIFDY
jgi:hypothetical protein